MRPLFPDIIEYDLGEKDRSKLTGKKCRGEMQPTYDLAEYVMCLTLRPELPYATVLSS